MRARFLRAAELEVDEAVTYFDAQRDGLGDRFERDRQNTVTFVTTHPLSGRAITDRVQSEGFLRVIDESGEDYPFPEENFVPIELPAEVKKLSSARFAINNAQHQIRRFQVQ